MGLKPPKLTRQRVGVGGKGTVWRLGFMGGKLNILYPESTDPADMGGVGVIVLGYTISVCRMGEVRLADNGVSGRAVDGVSTLCR